MKGLLVDVYRNLYSDFTLGGISSKHKSLLLTGENVPEIFEPTNDKPEVKLVRRWLFGSWHLHAEPVDPPPAGYVGWMFGGNYIKTSDSRFPNPYPIPVHDRAEPRELYDELSK